MKDLEENYISIESAKVKDIYERAKAVSPNIQKTFEEISIRIMIVRKRGPQV